MKYFRTRTWQYHTLRPAGFISQQWIWTIAILLSPTSILFAATAPLHHGDAVGDNIVYLDVTEGSISDEYPQGPDGPVGFFGEPDVTGDVIAFNSPALGVRVFPGLGVDFTDAWVTFRMQPVADLAVDTLLVREVGAIGLSSPGSATMRTTANVRAPVVVTVYEVALDNGEVGGERMTLPAPLTIQSELVFTPPKPSPVGWDSVNNPDLSDWSGELFLDIIAELLLLDPTLDDSMPLTGATDLQFSMTNSMVATAEDGLSSAFINKEEILLNPAFVDLISLPEPSAWCMVIFTAGMGLVYWRRRCSGDAASA